MPEALLRAWLADPRAPRLCLVPELPPVQLPGVTVLSLAGQGVLGAVWSLANTLGVAARTPGELLSALLADGRRRVLALPGLADAEDPKGLAELILSLADLGCLRLLVESPPPLTTRLSQGPSVLLEELEQAHWPDDDDLTSLDDPGTSLEPLAPTQPAADGVRAPAPDAARPHALDGAGSPTPGDAPPPAPDDLLPPPAAPLDLDDPRAVCVADPKRVTVAYDREGSAHGGLGQAWLRAGQAVTREVGPAVRAFALLAALGEDADAHLRPTLSGLAGDVPWRLVASRVRGDRTPAWPGAAAALALDAEGRLLLADGLGTVRTLRVDDLAPAAEPVATSARPRGLAALADGTLLLLDERGRLRTERGPGSRLTRAVAETLALHPGSALTTAAGAVLVGDRMGSVHAFGIDGVHQAALHAGRVTALASVAGPAPLACSGGADGAV
ncbi:hypothetical protein, partial [Streptomyces sp.]|uniref:hypothetical protein n=1 Tax=Streptomyces sp. TaxID=1931 RepID=UPI002F93F245